MLPNHQMQGSRNSLLFVERARRHTHTQMEELLNCPSYSVSSVTIARRNPARLRSEFKVLPTGADLKAKEAGHQETARDSELMANLLSSA